MPFDDREYVHQMSVGLAADSTLTGPSTGSSSAGDAARGFQRLPADLFQSQRAAPGDNVISGMIQAAAD